MEYRRYNISNLKGILILAISMFLCGIYSYILNDRIDILGTMKIISLGTCCIYMSSLLVLIQTKGQYIDNIYKINYNIKCNTN